MNIFDWADNFYWTSDYYDHKTGLIYKVQEARDTKDKIRVTNADGYVVNIVEKKPRKVPLYESIMEIGKYNIDDVFIDIMNFSDLQLYLYDGNTYVGVSQLNDLHINRTNIYFSTRLGFEDKDYTINNVRIMFGSNIYYMKTFKSEYIVSGKIVSMVFKLYFGEEDSKLIYEFNS